MPQGCHKLRFAQSSDCISEETKAQLVASLHKIITDKYQELGLGLLTQGYLVFPSVYIMS